MLLVPELRALQFPSLQQLSCWHYGNTTLGGRSHTGDAHMNILRIDPLWRGPRLSVRVAKEPQGYAVVLDGHLHDHLQTLACGLEQSQAEAIAHLEARERGIEVHGG